MTADLSDLESAVCDVADMATVAQILLDKADKEAAAAAEMDISAQSAAKAVAYWRDAATFAVLHLKGMTVDLRKQYYAEIERAR
jgi:hypothetical protein